MSIDLAAAHAIKGWMHADELQWLAERAQACQTIIEFGCFKGRSTRALADHCPGVVYAVDPWSGTYPNNEGTRHKTIHTDVFDEFSLNLQDHINAGSVVPVKAMSGVSPQILARCGVTAADLVFIDGDHRYEVVLDDIRIAGALTRPGGIIAGHDYSHPSWPGVRRAVDERFPQAQHCRSIWWVTA